MSYTPTPLEVAKAALATIAFQGLSVCSEVAKKALEQMKELESRGGQK